MDVRIEGIPLVSGAATAPLLVSQEPLSFWGGYNPTTGEVIDRRHPLSGQFGATRILAIPGTRGSSTTTAVLLEAIRNNVAPAGFVVTAPDTFLTLASVVADEMYGSKVPVLQITRKAFTYLKSGQLVQITHHGALISPRKSTNIDNDTHN